MLWRNSSSKQCGLTLAYQTVSGRVRATTSYVAPALASCAARPAWHSAKEVHCETARMRFSVWPKKPERKQPRASDFGRAGPACDWLLSVTATGRKAHAAAQTGWAR